MCRRRSRSRSMSTWRMRSSPSGRPAWSMPSCSAWFPPAPDRERLVTAKPRPTEFELIARYFAPLAAGAPGAASLSDDVALVSVANGEELVLKTDAVVAGIHFTGDEPARLIARKLLRV